jgi:hypothetical protein
VKNQFDDGAPMEVETPQEFFDEVLPRRFKPDKAKGIDVVTQVNLTGPNGGDWRAKNERKKRESSVTKPDNRDDRRRLRGPC